MLKFVVLKSWKTIHYISKLYSNLLSNPRGVYSALEAEEPKNWLKFSKKLRGVFNLQEQPFTP